MKLTGEFVAEGVKTWLQNEIINSPSARHELGKFCFGVSTGTIAVLATLIRLGGEGYALTTSAYVSFVALLLSMIVALVMALPTIISVTSKLDIYDVYNKSVRNTTIMSVVWFGLWFCGVMLGAVRVFGNASNPAPC